MTARQSSLIKILSRLDGRTSKLHLVKLAFLLSKESVDAPNSFTTLGHVSPDGHWLAYTSSESGAPEVYVAGFHGPGKWQVSATGGVQAKWSSDGKELYYMDPRFNLLSVPVKEVDGALQFASPQQLVSNWSAPQVFYDVSPDGKKILLDKVSQHVSQSVTVVTNFTAGVKKK